MKKISRKNLQGLRSQFPVLSEEEMRYYVGGYDGGYSGGGIGDDWLNHGFYFVDPDGNSHWYRGYTQEELDNWKGDWTGGWVYGLGYVSSDGFCYGTYQGGNNYNPWGDYDAWGNGYPGWPGTGYPGYFGFYGYYGYNDSNDSGNNGNWGGGGGSGSNGSSTSDANGNDGDNSGVVIDLKGTCVYDSLAELMLRLQNKEKTDEDVRKEYFEYLKTQRLSDEEILELTFSGVKGKYVEGLAEYLGFEAEALSLQEVFLGIQDGTRESITGIAVVKIVTKAEDGSEKIDYHAVTILGAVSFSQNGEITGVGFKYEDKSGEYRDHIIYPEGASDFEKSLLDPMDIITFYEIK